MGIVLNKKIDTYSLYLKEKHRPPSKGGNSKALHAHVLTIEGEQYSFLAPGSQQWVYKRDEVSFEFELNGHYRNINKDTITANDQFGNPVVRGNREFKKKLRTAETRTPVSRREMKK